MSSYNTIETPQDYVNYTFNITSRGITEVTGELAGLSNTVTTILGQLAFKTSEYLTHTESLMISMGAVSAASFASATKEAMKFEQAIANVQAIGGESINAMQIGQAAMQYSNQFGMDVNSMTEGLEALSRAGLSATNVMSGVLAEGVKLSKLEGMDLEDSINDLISSTNLLAETDIDVNSQEYADAVRAMNQHIVSTSESSPINAQNIMQSLQHVGGYVSSNKIDQDDLFAVIAQLGAKGTKGEMAGTALRAFVAAGQKDQAQRALSRIGLDVSDLWDESGEAMLPISEMKDVLDNALEARGYSKQEKLEFYADFVGYKQANQIMKIDSTEVQQYKETIAHAWDLGKKLDTILGTTHNNMQILFQTIKNFMTKVGQSTLPILNAIVTPIKWGVQLLDAMPFSENITGMILAFGTLKAILLVINRVVPSIASMYTSFSSGEEKAKGIAGHFKNMYNDLTKSYDILTHITDSKYLSKIRVAEGFMGQQSYKQHQYVTQEIYKLYTQDNPNADKWFELAPIERELFESLTEAMKDTEVYKNIEGKYKEKSQKEALNIITFMENPQRASVTYGESKQDINKRISEKTQANNDAVNVSQQLKNEVRDFAQELNNSLIKKAETQEEKDITSAILNTKEALAEAIGRSVAQSFRTREVEVSKDLGSFEIDKRVASGAIKQLQEIETQVSNELGDIGYFLKDDIDAIDNLISTVRYDLQQKISAYSNTNPSYMNHVQEQRMEKGISRAAKTNLGLLYSSEQNNIDILNVLRNNKWNRPNDSRLGIRDAQMDAIEEALHMDSGAGKDRDTRLTKIHNELQAKYEGKEKEAKIAEILEKTEAIWLKAEKEKEVPSVVASRHLTDARAQHIGNAIGLGGFNWAQIDNAADVLTEYFKDAKTNPKKQQELKRADKMLFSFLEEAKGAGEVFNAAEIEELGYLIRRYKQLMAARVQAEEKANKSFDKNGGWMNPLSANVGPEQAYRENIKNGGGFHPNADLSQFSWKDNFENFMQTAIINAFDAPVRNKWGISYGSEIEINPGYIKDTSQAFFSDTLNTLLHESAHSILQHQERYTNTASSLYIGHSDAEWRGSSSNIIAELEASMVANLAMQKMGIDVEKDQIRQQQELLQLWSKMGEPDGLLSFADLNHLADEMANHVNDFVEMTRTLMDVAKSQEVLSNVQPSNVLTEKEKAKLVDIENRFASIRKKRTGFATGPHFHPDDDIIIRVANKIFKKYDAEERNGPNRIGKILYEDFPDVAPEYKTPIWDAVRDLMKNEAEAKAQSASDTLTLNETVFNKGIEKILNKMDDMTNINAIDIQIPLLDKLLNNQLIEKENYDKALLSLSDTLTSTINGTPAGQASQLDDVKDKLDKILENTEEDAALRKAMLERLMHLNEKEPSSLNQPFATNRITAYGQTITVYGHVVDSDENMANNDILQLTTSIYKILPALTKTNIDDAISKIDLLTQLQNILNNKNLALPAYNDGNFIPPHQFTEEEIKNIRAFTLYCMAQISKAQQQIENDIESSAFAVELMSNTMHLHDVLSSPLESGSSDKLPNFANEKGIMSILAILPALHTLINNIENAENAENIDSSNINKKSNFIDLSKVTLVQDAYPNFIMQNDPGLIQKILILEMLKTFPVSSLSNISQYSTPAKNEDNDIYPIINGFNLLFENIRYWIANINNLITNSVMFNPITQSLPFESDIVIDTNTIEIKTRPAIDITGPHFDYLDMMQAELAQQNSSLIGPKTKTQIAQAIYKNPFSITRDDLVHAGMQDRIEEWEQNKNIMANPVNKKIVNAMEKITENEHVKYQQSQIPSLTRTEAEKMVMENPFKITEEDLKFLGMEDLIQTLHQNRDTINRRYQRQSNEEYSNIYSDPLEDHINAIEEVNKTLYDEDFLNTFTKENKEFINKLSEIADNFINKQETLNERTINAIQPFLEKTLSDNQKEMNQHTKTTPKDTTTFQNNQFRTNTNIGVQNLKHSYKNAGMISIMDAEGNELNMDELIDEINERDTILQSLLEADKNATEIGNKIKDDIQKRNEFLRDRILASNENVKQMAQEMYALDYAKDPSSVPDYILDILGWQSAEGKEAERKRQKEQKFKSKDKGVQNRIAEQQAQNAKQNQEDFINLSNFAQSEMPTMEEKNQKRLKEDIIAARRIDEDRAEQAYIQEHVGPDIEALKKGQEQANAQIEQEYNRQRVQADIDSLKLKQQQLEQEEKFLENQKDLLNVAQQVTETVQKQKQEEEFLNAQKDLLNISNTITQQQNATAGLKNLDKTIEEAQIAKQKEQEQQAISNAGKMFNDFDEYQKQFRILSKVNEDIEKNRAGYKVKNTAKDIRQFIDDAPGKGISFLGNLLGVSSKGMTHKDVKQEAEENDYLGKTSAKITELNESLKPFNQALYQAGEIFPPFTIAAATMSKTMSALTMVAGALNFIEQLRLALLGEEYIAEEGSLAAKLLGIAATWAASNSEAALTGARIIGQIETWKTAISETVLGAIRAFISGPLLLPVIAILAAIAATLATLYFWEKQHANALKDTQEQLQKATAENNIAMSQYKDLKKSREAETDAIKRQQKARKEAIALYELEAARVKRRRLVHDEANLRNDAVWGEYGLRAAMQKMGLGFIAGGDFESQYENYDGTTKNIRQIKEETVGNLFATSSQRQVASFYDNNSHFLAEVEAYKEPLQELYDKESKLIEKYGSIDAARGTKEFEEAVQEFADATGINGKTAGMMLDWLETENRVDKATTAMQTTADVIVAKANANAMKAMYPELETEGEGFSGVENAMIMAQAESIYKDAYDQMWWDAFGNRLWGYFNVLLAILDPLGIFGNHMEEAQKYFGAAEAYDEGMKELVDVGIHGLYEQGEEAAEAAERRDYGLGTYAIDYGDTPFGAAKEASAAAHADEQQRQAYANNGQVYSESEYLAIQDQYQQDTYGKTAQQQKQEAIQENERKRREKEKQNQESTENQNQESTEKQNQESTEKQNDTLSQLQSNQEVAHNDALNIIDAILGNPGAVSGAGAGVVSIAESSNPLFKSLRKRAVKDVFKFMEGGGDTLTEKIIEYAKPQIKNIQAAYADDGLKGVYNYGKNAIKGSRIYGGLSKGINAIKTEAAVTKGLYSKYGAKGLLMEGNWLLDKGVDVVKGSKTYSGLSEVASNIKTAPSKIGGIRGLVSSVSSEVGGVRGLASSTVSGMTDILNPKTLAGGIDDIVKGARGGGTLMKGIGKVGGRALAFLGPALAFADKAAELNPFEGKHYNEDGTEKKALQATGEVVGTTVGALGGVAGGMAGAEAGAVLGATIGSVIPGVGTVIGGALGAVAGGIAGGWLGDTIFQPIGDAIGGTIGWLGDNLLSGIQDVAGNVWNGLTEAAGGVWEAVSGVASGVWDAVSGVASGVWDFITGANDESSKPVKGILGWTPIGMGINIASGINNWLTDSGMWDAVSDAATGVWDFITGANDESNKPIKGVLGWTPIGMGINVAAGISDWLTGNGNQDKQVQYKDEAMKPAKSKHAPQDNSQTTVIIKNININTEDDPEKIKSALMNLIIEMQEQVSPRQVSRTVGEPPSVSTDASTDTNNQDQAEGQDEQNANGNTNTNNNPTT